MSVNEPESLGDRFGLDQRARDALAMLARCLTGDPHAPTTIRDPDAVWADHIADSLVGMEIPAIDAAAVIVDIGAGAGLPGLVLAAARPWARLVEVEATGRKCEFIARTAEAMGLDNVEVRHARAEECSDLAGAADVVTARALAPLPVLAEYAAPLLRIGGSLVAWRGQTEPEVEAQTARAAALLGLGTLTGHPVSPYPGAVNRHLYLLSKVNPTPARFPRRVGMARKRPLGSG